MSASQPTRSPNEPLSVVSHYVSNLGVRPPPHAVSLTTTSRIVDVRAFQLPNPLLASTHNVLDEFLGNEVESGSIHELTPAQRHELALDDMDPETIVDSALGSIHEPTPAQKFELALDDSWLEARLEHGMEDDDESMRQLELSVDAESLPGIDDLPALEHGPGTEQSDSATEGDAEQDFDGRTVVEQSESDSDSDGELREGDPRALIQWYRLA